MSHEKMSNTEKFEKENEIWNSLVNKDIEAVADLIRKATDEQLKIVAHDLLKYDEEYGSEFLENFKHAIDTYNEEIKKAGLM